ncbi:MAG: hypothetical protein ACC628_27330 [Pirellulaceae bacterium]
MGECGTAVVGQWPKGIGTKADQAVVAVDDARYVICAATVVVIAGYDSVVQRDNFLSVEKRVRTIL